MKRYSLNFEKLSEVSKAMYEKAHALRCIDMDEEGKYIIPSGLHPSELAEFLDEMRGIIDATDYDTMLVEDEEGSLLKAHTAEESYRVERTKKPVRAINTSGYPTSGLADVIILWDDEEGIGLELPLQAPDNKEMIPPFGDIVAKKEGYFRTPEGRKHGVEIADKLKEYALNHLEIWDK